jgi:hypothetical protein
MKKIVTKCLALMLMGLTLFLLSTDSTKTLFASSQSSGDAAQLLTIVQADQGAAPLRIVHTFVETPSPERTIVRVIVQNQSPKKIRALTITADTRIEFLNLTGKASILLPTQIKTLDITYTGEERPKRVVVSVDFVEFGDGSTWGADVGNSSDRLAGQRAGVKAERQRLKNILKSKDRASLINMLEAGVPDQPEGAGAIKRSEEWQQGYRSAVGSIRYRVRQALQTSNPEQVELELNKPYDTSEEN